MTDEFAKITNLRASSIVRTATRTVERVMKHVIMLENLKLREFLLDIGIDGLESFDSPVLKLSNIFVIIPCFFHACCVSRQRN